MMLESNKEHALGTAAYVLCMVRKITPGILLLILGLVILVAKNFAPNYLGAVVPASL